MKLNENWLRQWVNPNLTAEQVGEQLTMAGLELDDLTQVARDFSGVVVGEVITCVQHPDADKLKVTTVNVGEHSDEPLQIVCGAPNVAVGVRVPVALVGAKLPPVDGDNKPFSIKKGKLRGVESNGMLCGGSEIDCDDGVDGLLILPNDAPIGMDVREYLALDNHVLDISITPNRGDCFSVRGLAREVAVLNGLDFATPFETKPADITTNDSIGLGVHTDDCPRYFAQVVTGVNGIQKSPDFIQKALNGSGITPKNLLVDVTNFVLMELGQPLHAFDKDKLVGQIGVRVANKGEKLTLLNDEQIEFVGDELVICDDDGVIALAGIMGGSRTAVSDSTQNVVIESAFFRPSMIAGKARRFGLHTDASQRFERGVDFELPQIALNRAVNLLKDFGGGKVGQISQHDNTDALPKQEVIDLPFDKIKSLLGVDVDKKNCIDILNKLDIKTVDNGETLVCTPPSHRFDISIAEDLVEEIARIYGYNNIANQLPKLAVNMYANDHDERLFDLKVRLVEAGYAEAVTFSFSDAKLEQMLDDDALGAMLPLANPISSDLAVMRRTLLSSLLPSVQYNLNRQQSRIRFFETGLSFVGANVAQLKQTPSIALVAVGTAESERNTAMNASRAMDFFDLKHDVERLFPNDWINTGGGKGCKGIQSSCLTYQRSQWAFLHPGQSADIFFDGQAVGWLGQLHPSIADVLDLPTTWVAQLASDALIALNENNNSITPLSKFPQVRRDIAILVDANIALQSLNDTIKQSAGELLIDSWLFDVYEGEHVPAGQRSLAFALVYQDINNTLDDVTVAALTQVVVDALTQEHQAVLRDS